MCVNLSTQFVDCGDLILSKLSVNSVFHRGPARGAVASTGRPAVTHSWRIVAEKSFSDVRQQSVSAAINDVEMYILSLFLCCFMLGYDWLVLLPHSYWIKLYAGEVSFATFQHVTVNKVS